MDEGHTEVKAKAITLVDPKTLKFYSRNTNKHTPEQIERLAKLIKHHGMRDPLTVWPETGEVITGNGTLEACLKLQMEAVPVVYQEFKNPDEAYTFSVSHNAIQEWSDLDLSQINVDIQELGPIDIELLGLKDFEVEPADKYADKDADAVPEVPKEPVSKLGDLYELGNHRVLCGDSTVKENIDRLMNGEKADMVFTDPPYGMSVVKKDGQNNGLGAAIDGVVGVVGVTARGLYREVVGDDTTETAKKSFNLLSDYSLKTNIFWGANFYAEALPPSSGWIVWDKENGEGFFADGELAWSNDEKQLRIFRHQWKGMIRASEMGQKRVHPTQKPIALSEWCFDNYGNPKSVLDGFLGSGSTLIACEKTNRKCYGMEIDPHYIDVIISRYCKFTGQTKVKRNGEEMEWKVPE